LLITADFITGLNKESLDVSFNPDASKFTA
jgi:hypothetical protein